MGSSSNIKISENDITDYQINGVVCIRKVLDQNWIDRILKASIRQIGNPTGTFRKDSNSGESERFFAGTHMSRGNRDFMDFALNSPAAEIAAKVMQIDEVRFFYDQLFIKEPGALAPTAWHHDLPFWPFDGDHIASVWIACTPVNMETSGLVYVARSHKWKKLFKPVPAVPIENFLSEEAKEFEECPMFHKEFDNDDYEFLSWDMEPGDVLVHHPLTVHGSGRNASSSQRRVALSLRYFGGNATWHGPRTTFAVPGTEGDKIFEIGSLPVNDNIFPICWKNH